MAEIKIILDALTQSPHLKQTRQELELILKALDKIEKNKDALSSAKGAKDIGKLSAQIEKLRLQNERLRQSQEKRSSRTKQKLLEEQGLVGSLNKRVRDLNSAIKSTKNVKELERLNAELKQTRNNMRELKRRGVPDTNTFSKALNSFAFKFNFLGNAASTAAFKVASFVSGLGRKAAKAVVGFGAGVDELSAITGATGKDLDDLKERAIGLGVDTNRSAVKIVDAFKLVGSAKPELLQNSAALESVTKEVVTLSKASGLDLATSTKAVTQTLNQFNLGAEEAGRVVNVLAAGSKFGAAEIPALNEAIVKFGTSAKTANVSVEESVGLVELLAEKGIVGAEAGTKLRNVLQRLNTAKALPKEALEQLEKFGVNTDILTDNTLSLNERLTEFSKISDDATAITKVFGRENSEAGQIVLQNVDRFAELAEQVEGTNTAIEQAEQRTDNFKEAQVELGASYENLAISINESSGVISQALTNVTQGLTDILNTFTELNNSETLSIFDQLTAILNPAALAVAETKLEMEGLAKAALAVSSQQQLNDFLRDTRVLAEEARAELKDGSIDYNEFAQKLAAIRAFNSKAIQSYIESKSALAENKEEVKENTEEVKENTEEVKENSAALEENNKKKKKQIDFNKLLRDNAAKDLKEAFKTEEKSEDLLAKKRKELEEEKRKDAEETIEQRLELLEKERQDVLDMNSEIQEARERAAEEQKERAREAVEQAIDLVEAQVDAVIQASERQQEAIEQQITSQEDAIERQRRLAEKGLDNTLAFEEKKKAELQKQLQDEQKRAERLEKIKAYFKLFSAFADEDPKSAAQKALKEIIKAEIISGTFKDGGRVGDKINRKGIGGRVDKGVFRGRSHRRGGILIEAEEDEGILSAKQMGNLGTDNFYRLQDALNNPNSDIFEQQSEQLILKTPKEKQQPDVAKAVGKAVEEALERVKPTQINWDEHGNMIETTYSKGVKTITKKVRSRRRLPS